MKAFIFSLLCLLLPFCFQSDLKGIYFPYCSEWQNTPPEREVLSILNQKFHYLSQGSQCLVFQSEDEKFVLKILTCNRSLFSGLITLKNFFKKTPKQQRRVKLKKALDAYQIAANEAAPFTQVIYCHLNTSQIPFPEMTLLGKKIDLNRCRFALQKKVKGFSEALLQAKEDPEKLEHLIDSFFSLLEKRSSLGIFNSDPSLFSNFGFLDEKAVEMDFGSYQKKEIDAEREKREKMKHWNKLSSWFSKHIPSSVKYLKKHRESC